MRRVWRLTLGNERGTVFLSGLVMVLIMTLLGATLFDLSRVEQLLISGDVAAVQSMYCAEAALTRWINVTAEINAIRAVPAGGTLTSPAFPGTAAPGTLNTPNGPCTGLTINYVDDLAAAEMRLTATGTPPATAAVPGARGARILLNFLAPPFEYAAVANNGPLHIRGEGAPNYTGAGGADAIRGDIWIHGDVTLGELGTGQDPAVNPFSTTDARPTISLPEAPPPFFVRDNSGAFPAAGDPSPFGYRPGIDEPKPDVAGYVNQVKAAAGITALDPTGSMVGSYRGAPVYNLKALFDPTVGLGRAADGSLVAPAGCPGPIGATGKCKIYWDLKPLGLKMNPGDRGPENADTTGDDYYFDGVFGGEMFPNRAVSGAYRGARRYVDMAIPSSPPPVFLADGNARFHAKDTYGFGVNGRGNIVATNDILISDNVIYKDGVYPTTGGKYDHTGGDTNTDPKTADMLGLVAQRDIWYGDPRYGTFVEGSGLMLAGRDFNFVFFKTDGSCCRTPENAVTLNGTMLANRQIAMFRDWVHESTSDGLCGPGQDNCKPVAYDPTTGMWRVLMRAADGTMVSDPGFAPFLDCGAGAGGCVPGTRRVTHYQMTVNYETRLRLAPGLVPPGLPTGAGLIFAGWQSWRECPPCT